MSNGIRQGIYNVEYFSGSQAAIYIGDVLVDEITSFAYSVSQSRRPIYGYASQLFDVVAEGTVLIQGQFSINFKEAGYLWLVLNRYKEMMNRDTSGRYARLTSDVGFDARGPRGDKGDMGSYLSPYHSGKKGRYKNHINHQSIESIINGEPSTFERNRYLQGLAKTWGRGKANNYAGTKEDYRRSTSASVGGYASEQRRIAKDGDNLGSAEAIFEDFEDAVWADNEDSLEEQYRRCDHSVFNPFDIYLTFGDFAGTDYDNHTIKRLRDIYIIGAAQQIIIDGNPIQETYSFIARNIV